MFIIAGVKAMPVSTAAMMYNDCPSMKKSGYPPWRDRFAYGGSGWIVHRAEDGTAFPKKASSTAPFQNTSLPRFDIYGSYVASDYACVLYNQM